MAAGRQPATVPVEFLRTVKRWAQRQPEPVSVILFGSRARGDYGPESDWDIGLVFDGDPPSLDDLPLYLEDRRIDWARFEHSHAMRLLNVCSLPHAMAADGVCLHGDPLPRPERKDVNIQDAWDNLAEAHEQMISAMTALVRYWNRPLTWRRGYNTVVARDGAAAGELLCKAALSMRGLEPRRSHLVTELCGDLEDSFPDDPLLPLLGDCGGQTAKAHMNLYANLTFDREDVDLSARRLAAALRASGAVLAQSSGHGLSSDVHFFVPGSQFVEVEGGPQEACGGLG